jgi:gamma-glutamylcyclotransferase
MTRRTTHESAARFYFAYGSNMSSRRLVARVPGAISLGRAHLPDWELVCNKRGRDESGKANLIERTGARAWGVIYRLDPSHWNMLDRFEPGYTRETSTVIMDTRATVDVTLYLADPPLESLPPLDWYRDYLIDGAEEHRLPEEYVCSIREWSVQVTARLEDPSSRNSS